MASIESKPSHTLQKRSHVSALGLVEPPPIVVECSAFQGTLATLFLLVKDGRLNLAEIPLAPICQAYFEYLVGAPDHSLNEAASALAALAYLLERKAWGLLPSEEEEPETEEFSSDFNLTASIGDFDTCIRALLVYKGDRDKLFFRSEINQELIFPPELELEDLSVVDLAKAFRDILEKAAPDPTPPMLRERRNLAEVMKEILLRLHSGWQGLSYLLPASYTITDAVYCFLAILELIKIGQVKVEMKESGAVFARS